ncbi:MAG: T9SS type A sorting domain-containing protein [Bacteroidales bacterium]|nr:T9SS type A sorting domain-containing protein [Bacteroidales bacterium]
MRKFTLFATLVAMMISFNGWGQTSTQDFGSGTGSHTSQTGSTAFLPNPTSGTTWVRAGAVAPNAPIVLSSTSNPLGTTGSFVRGVASSSTSVTKLSPIVGYSGNTEFYTSFKILFGDALAGSTATSGSWTFYQGSGAMYSDASDFAGAQVFTGIRFTYGASGALALNYRGGGSWSTTGLSTTSFNQATVYTIEIIGNNKVSGAINYTYYGNAYSVAIDKFDLIINGTLVGDDLSKAQLANNTNIISNTFIGISSTSNAANIFVDDVHVYNSVPSEIGTAPSTPTIYVAPTSLSGFTYIHGSGPSTSQSFTVSGSNLTPAGGNIAVSCITNYEVSSNNSTFSSSITLPYTSGSLSSTSVYVRLKAALNPGLYTSESITVSGGGATNQNVSCSGSVTVSNITQYRSKGNDNWNDPDTWEINDGSNWYNAYDWPTDATKDVTIRTGHTVVNPAGYYNAKANNLTIETGAKLWANSTSGASFVYVYGDFTNNGTVGGTDDVIGFDIEGANCTISGTGTFAARILSKFTDFSTTTNLVINQDVTLTATGTTISNSTFSPGDMYNITISSGRSLTSFGGTVNLTDATLTLEDGAMFIENGVIAGMNNNCTYKRNISGNNTYHLISSPVQMTTAGDVFPSAHHNNIWLRSYNESLGIWANLTIANGIGKGDGLSITMDVASTTATFTGEFWPLDWNPPLTNSGTSGNANYDGWNLIGNPFTAPLDWDHASWAKTNIDNTVYTWSASGGNYVSWNGTTGGLTDGIIPVAQGFFVKANAASPAINIPPTARVLNTQAYYKNTVSELLSLKVSGTANTYSDETFINYNTEASPLFDNAFDAFHLDGDLEAPQLWTVADQKYAINVMKSVAESSEINMAFKAGVEAEYTITASGMETFEGNLPIWLNDLVLGSRQDLRQNSSYTFTAKPDDNINRFKITFAGVGVDNPEQAAIRMYTQPGNIYINLPSITKGQLNIYNLSGQLVYRQDINASGLLNVSHRLTTGTYIVQLVSEQQTVNQKLFIQ